VRALGVFVPLVAGCTFLGLDDLELARCAADADCAALNADLADDPCQSFACDVTAGRCVLRTLDEDGDGEPAMTCGGLDCDDTLATVGPTAQEVCNGVDDDCNGLLDGPDEDDDADMHADQCAGDGATDCDDENGRTNFDEPEICDGIDNDCVLDGFLRFTGGLQLEPTEDVDGDLHASPGAMCTSDPGEPTQFPLDDCNDEDGLVYTGAPETCDGIDNDCDGIPDDAPDTTTPGSTCVPVSVYPGPDGSCALGADGFVTCWGDNTSGQLGNPGVDGEASVRVPGIAGASSIAMGSGFACALIEGRVVCWGRDVVLRPGIMSFMIRGGAFGEVADLGTATAIDAGGDAACAVLDDATVRCWGLPRFGVVNGTWDLGMDSTVVGPTAVPGVTDVTRISVGQSSACGLHSDGTLTCWGANFGGVLGDGTADGMARISEVIDIDDAIDVGVGSAFACALREGGRVACWGTNSLGQLGCGACAEGGTPREVTGITGAVELAVGSSFACVRQASGAVSCWGDNGGGQLGNGSEVAFSGNAVAVEGIADAVSLRAGSAHVCAVRPSGAFCWGEGANRRLGDGRVDHPRMSMLRSSVPRSVSVLANAVEIAMGNDDTCLRLPNLTVRCFGQNTYGEIDGMSGFVGIAHRAFGDGIASIARGASHACVIETGGTVRCFGDSRNGRLGGELGEPLVADLDRVAELALGDQHSCARKTDGTVWCWGQHTDGEVGIGNVAVEFCGSGGQVCQPTPLELALSDIRQLAAGGHHTCALGRGGKVWCWGRNDRGQLGSPPLGISRAPREVVGLPSEVISLEAGGDVSCALLVDRSVVCWGSAPGVVTTGIDPSPVLGLSGVQEIVVAGASACARLASGQVRCWGQNDTGQLGNGTTTDSPTPVNVLGLPDAREIECGPSHCCATRTSGQTVCWGQNAVGRLGTGDDVVALSPRTTVDLLAL
jgi:alpha-tubulin suppressor-like RCC1 family protein